MLFLIIQTSDFVYKWTIVIDKQQENGSGISCFSKMNSLLDIGKFQLITIFESILIICEFQRYTDFYKVKELMPEICSTISRVWYFSQIYFK